jgi:GntR family transcriptional regulator
MIQLRPMNIQLNFRSELPLTNQIVEQIQHLLDEGLLKPGDQLPTVRALATELRINFNTVARAYRMLDEVGIISTQQGRGTYIMEKPPPVVGERLRRESLQNLAHRYLNEARRLGFDRQQALQIFQQTAEQEMDSQSETE